MARDYDPYKVNVPSIYLFWMTFFLVVVLFGVMILYRPLTSAFHSNIGLNSGIVIVGICGVLLTFGQVLLLFREVNWLNSYRAGHPRLEMRDPPNRLAPMASLLGDRVGYQGISTSTMRSILETIGSRLDESREVSRYLTGLMVFLGLLGTFWGLLTTVGSISNTIQSLDVGSGEANVIFEDLKAGLEAPLAGMGTAFSSSLFGLAGSLVLGFMDLQAGQAQNRFYTELEDWLSTVTEITAEDLSGAGQDINSAEDLKVAIERLSRMIQEDTAAPRQQAAGSSKSQIQAMANLAEGIQGLVKHMRSQQGMMREWAEAQAEQQREIKDLLGRLANALEQEDN